MLFGKEAVVRRRRYALRFTDFLWLIFIGAIWIKIAR
jgi:hypothetical protein